MQKYLFIDRDGTIIESPPPGGQVDSFEKLHFYPFVITWLGKIATELDYQLVLVTNQNGLGTSIFPEKDYLPPHNFMLETFKNEGIIFSNVIIDHSMPEEHSEFRKPRTGRMKKYLLDPNADIKNSFVIGDRLTDVQFAKNLGCKAIFINPENTRGQVEITDTAEELRKNTVALGTMDWKDVYTFLKKQAEVVI